MKPESLPTQNSSPKLFLELTHGFVTAHSPCWLRNSQGKLFRCRLKKHHRNCFQSWRMDSSAHTAPVDSRTIKENWVVANSEIITETVSRDDTRNPQRTQHLLTMKQSRKTEWLPSQKSSPKMFIEVTHGFVSAHSPCLLKNKEGKLSLCPLRNCRRNYFQRLHMESSAHTAPVDS